MLNVEDEEQKQRLKVNEAPFRNVVEHLLVGRPQNGVVLDCGLAELHPGGMDRHRLAGGLLLVGEAGTSARQPSHNKPQLKPVFCFSVLTSGS